MFVRLWGVRGSIPVPGPRTVRYGGNTSCIEVRADDGRMLIIDAGSGIRELGNFLLKNDLKNGPISTDIFLTHTHWDHIHGYPFFTPIYFKQNQFTIHGPVNAISGSLEQIFSAQMDYSYYPVKLEDTGAKVNFSELKEGSFIVNGFKVSTCYLNHPVLCIGYRIEVDDRVFCTVYDHEPYQNIFARNGVIDSEEAKEAQAAVDEMNMKVVNHIKGADMVVYDAQYHNAEEYNSHRGWGHSTVQDAVSYSIQAGVKRVCLFHHDPTRSDEELDALYMDLKEKIKKAGQQLVVFPAKEGLRVPL